MKREVSPRPVRAPQVLGSKEPSQLQDRQQEKKRVRRRLVTRAVGISVAVVAFIALVVWAVFFGPFFELRADAIHVQADQPNVDVEAVTAKVAQHEGVPLPRLSMGAIRKEILADPSVMDASVSRSWPDGLEVAVVGRVPKIALQTANGYDLFGQDAVQVGSAPEVPEGAVVLRNVDSLTPTQAADVVTVWNALDPDIKGQTVAMTLSGNLVTLELVGDRQAQWGTPAQSELKNKVLLLLLQQRSANTYDVTDPTRPSIR